MKLIDFDFHFFLKCVNITKFRVAMTRLMVSSRNICIETGRWQRPRVEVENILCNVCSKIKNEYQFILECIIYNDLRKQYIDRFYWQRPNLFKLKLLFDSINENTIKNQCIFIFKAFKIKQNEN